MTEREMTMHQRGMVDNCLEEGHYVRGIASLNQLRMERLKPSPDHIRQLIYISLYPPPQPTGDAKGKRREITSARSSPSKEIQQAKRLQRQALIPPPEATEAAKELLHQFTLDSISPESLICALPCYPLSQVELEDAPRPIKFDILAGHNEVSDEKDAEIAKEAVRLKECRDCWSMLREGVVTRRDAALTRMEDPFLDSDVLKDKGDDDPTSTIVGKYSWNLLDWFVRLFEKDQALAKEQNDEAPYSILLLSQIMPVSTGNVSRSYIESIVEIIFLCYNQTEQWRKSLGKRLMSLLISLTRCSHFSPLQLFKTISIRLQASSNSLVTEFLSDFPVSAVGLRVKLAICDRSLTHALQSSPPASADGIARIRPQARKARPTSIHTNGDSECPSRQQSGIATNQEYQAKWALPSSQRILRLLDPDSKGPSATRSRLKNLTTLFHMIIAFGTLQAKEGKTTDVLWAEAVRSGDLERRICDAYTVNGLPEDEARAIRALRLILISQCTAWERLVR